jgi:hypothetical protein
MKNYSIISIKKTILPLAAVWVIFPLFCSAAFVPGVPVEDALLEGAVTKTNLSLEKMQKAFDEYVVSYKDLTFENENRSLRAILSLNPDPGVSAELYLPGGGSSYPGGGKTYDKDKLATMKLCESRYITNPLMAKPSGNGAWQELIDNGKIEGTNSDFSTVEVSNSTSLSCLLQEIVEQNKLQINLQIHSLLQDYINTALSASLAQRTAGVIAKANIDWIKKGNVRTTYDENGLPMSQESFPYSGSNIDDYKKGLADARVKTIQQKILNGGPDDENNSLNVCASFKLSAARELLRQAHKTNSDPLDSLSEEVGCQLTNKLNPKDGIFANESDLERYYEDATVGNKSPIDTYLALLKNEQNTERGLINRLVSTQGSQLTNIKQTIDDDYQANGGYISGRSCDPSDPNCDMKDSRVTLPGSLIRDIATKSVTQQFEAVSNAKTPEDLASIAKDDYSSAGILSSGLDAYNTDRLIPDQSISKYVGDFLSGIQSGYFDIQKGTADWASGAMLQIYDATMSDATAFTGGESTQKLPVNDD